MKIDAKFLEKLKEEPSILQELLTRHGVPGMSLTVIQGGKRTFSTVSGVRDDNGTPMTSETVFECASLTKSMFATLVLRLADEGKIQLNQPITKQFDYERWSDDPRYDLITPIHALSHGTGFPGWAEKPMEIMFDPGTNFSYSGEGYYLLQHIIQDMEGCSMNDCFEKYFYKPWNLTHSAADWTPEVGKQMTWGYGMDSKVSKIRDSHDDGGLAPEPNAAWSLYSTTDEYAEFICRMITEHGGLKEETFNAMTTQQNHTEPGIGWGLGFGLVDADANVCWHWGDNGGFKNLSIWDKETGDGVVVFTNCDRGKSLYIELLKELTDGKFFDSISAFIDTAE